MNKIIYKVEDLPINLLNDNPYDQRKKSGDIEGLAESIKERGLQNPISVVKVDESYTIAHGHRRVHAYRYLKRTSIPAIIRRESTPENLMVDLAIENLQRKDLLPTEKGSTLQQLFYTIPNIQQKLDRVQSLIYQVKLSGRNANPGEGFTEEDITKAKYFLNMTGISTTSANIYVRLLTLPDDIQLKVVSADNTSLLPEGHVSIKSGYELSRINDPQLQKELFEKTVKDKMSHVELKHVVDELIEKDDKVAKKSNRGSAKRKTEDDAGIAKLTDELLGLSSSIENFRCKYLPIVSGRIEKAKWAGSLNKMKKICLDTVKNINDLLREDMRSEDLLEYVNADLEININHDMRYRFPAKIAEALQIKDGDILLLKVEAVKRLPPKLQYLDGSGTEVKDINTNEIDKINVEKIDDKNVDSNITEQN